MKKTGGNMTFTEQCFYPNSQENLGETNAVPHCTEFDLVDTACEQTFKVVRRGNQVTKGKNY